MTSEDINSVEELIEEDSRVTIHEIAHTTGIAATQVHCRSNNSLSSEYEQVNSALGSIFSDWNLKESQNGSLPRTASDFQRLFRRIVLVTNNHGWRNVASLLHVENRGPKQAMVSKRRWASVNGKNGFLFKENHDHSFLDCEVVILIDHPQRLHYK